MWELGFYDRNMPVPATKTEPVSFNQDLKLRKSFGEKVGGNMWTYEQHSGAVLKNGVVFGHGYSGLGEDKNEPANETVHGKGPIPRGEWRLCGVANRADTGPYSIDLEPCNGTETFGRSGFLIHGDSLSHPGSASHGCIILPRAIREAIWNSGDRLLNVVE